MKQLGITYLAALVLSFATTIVNAKDKPLTLGEWRKSDAALFFVLRTQNQVELPMEDLVGTMDATSAQVYLHGFVSGWDEGIRGELKSKATPPAILAERKKMTELWQKGCQKGIQAGLAARKRMETIREKELTKE
jgi:hypothetical protein